MVVTYDSWNYNYLCNQYPSQLRSCEFESHSWRGVHDTTLCDKVYQWRVAARWFSPVSPTNNTDHHDINEILLKAAYKHHNRNLFFSTLLRMLHWSYMLLLCLPELRNRSMYTFCWPFIFLNNCPVISILFKFVNSWETVKMNLSMHQIRYEIIPLLWDIIDFLSSFWQTMVHQLLK